MATHRFLLFLSILVSISFISATARPCKTILFINQNPNHPLLQNPKFLTLTFTQIPHTTTTNNIPTTTTTFISYPDVIFPGLRRAINHPPRFSRHFDESAADDKDKSTLDIMTVFVAILCGAGSGLLFSVAVYLIWYFVSPGRSIRFWDIDTDFDSDGDDDDVRANKFGYVAVPADAKVVDAATPAKQAG